MSARGDEPGGVIVLPGRLDVTTVADIRVVLHAAIDLPIGAQTDSADPGSGDVIVDASAVELLDATGLGVLVGSHRRAERAGRRLVLRDSSPALSRLLVRTRLYRVLHVERTPAAVA